MAETLAAGRCEDDILALVRHWAKTGSRALVQAALATFTWRFTPARGHAALAVIEATMTTPALWDDPRLPMHSLIQEETTEKVKDWMH